MIGISCEKLPVAPPYPMQNATPTASIPRCRSALVALIGLLALNLLAHFVPLERTGLEPDDYRDQIRIQAWSSRVFASAIEDPDRPLSWILRLAMADLIGQDPVRHTLAVLLGSSLVAVAAFLLFLEVVGRIAHARVLAALFVLCPAYHAVHGTLQFATSSAIACMFIASATLFLRFASTAGWVYLVLSLASYGVGLLCYELGALVPVVAWAVARWQRRPHHRWALAFVVVAAAHVLRRLLLDGISGGLGPERSVQWDSVPLNLFWLLPSHFVGHQMLRSVVYGLWGFVNMPNTLVVLGLATAVCVGRALARSTEDLPALDRKAALALAAGVVLLAAPAAAQLVESRHTVLASLAFAVLISEGLRFVASWLRWLAGVAVGILLLANQGLAFRQAEAGRLSARLLSSLTERRDVLGAVSHVVIDIDSLAREIPSGWNPRPTETLRSYWGLHLFAPWGLEAMVQLAGGRGDQLVVCQGGLRREGDSLSCRRAWPPGAHRWTGRAGEVHIVDFETVCGAHGAHCPPHWSGL